MIEIEKVTCSNLFCIYIYIFGNLIKYYLFILYIWFHISHILHFICNVYVIQTMRFQNRGELKLVRQIVMLVVHIKLISIIFSVSYAFLFPPSRQIACYILYRITKTSIVAFVKGMLLSCFYWIMLQFSFHSYLFFSMWPCSFITRT